MQRTYDGALTTGVLLGTAAVQLVLLAVGRALSGAPVTGDDSQSVLGSIWQVHAAFASIGFAGLAIAFQVLGDPPLSAGPARRSVVRNMKFDHLLASGVASSLLIGGATVFIPSTGTTAVALVAVLLPSVALVTIAYARLAVLFASPQRIESLTLEDLESRVGEAARAAADQEVSERAAERSLAPGRGLITNANWVTPGLPTRSVRFPLYAGVVNSIDVGALVHAADHLAWLANRGADPDNELFTYEYEQRIRVRARTGAHYRSGDALFEFQLWPGISEEGFAAISRQLMKAIKLGPETGRDPQAVFMDEMSTLQDNILAAVAEGRLSKLEKGYRYFEQVIHQARQERSIESNGLQDPRWFASHTWEIDEASARRSGRMALTAVEAAQRRAYAALRDGDLAWLQSALGRLTHIWSTLLEADVHHGDGPQENLLISLQNLAEFAIPYSFDAQASRDGAVQSVVWTFTSITKIALTAGDLPTATRVLGFSGRLHDLAPSERTSWIASDIGAAQSAIVAWILFLRAVRKTFVPIDFDSFPQRARQVDAIRVLRDLEDSRGQAPWRFWETEDSLPFEVRVLTFDKYLAQAVFLLTAAGRFRILPASDYTIDDRWLVERLLAGAVANEALLDSEKLDENLISALVKQLEQVVESLRLTETKTLAEQPLDDDRVNAFGAALAATLVEANSLARFLGEFADSKQAESQLLFVNIRVPKYYFLGTDVIALPENLGQQLGAAMLRGQDLLAIQALRADSTTIETSVESLPGQLEDLARLCGDPVLIYFGDPEVEDALTITFPGEEVELAGLPAYALYIDHNPTEQVILVDRSKSPSIFPYAEEKADLVKNSQGDVSIGVFDESAYPQPAQEGPAPEPTVRVETGQVFSWTPTTGGCAVFIRVAGLGGEVIVGANV